jgi:hypothetical protein
MKMISPAPKKHAEAADKRKLRDPSRQKEL